MSVANVSQLAVDLLIASLSLRRIAIFNSEFFVPVVGGREDGDDGITMPLERTHSGYVKPSVLLTYSSKVYGKSSENLLIMQQRSPVLKVRHLQ